MSPTLDRHQIASAMEAAAKEVYATMLGNTVRLEALVPLPVEPVGVACFLGLTGSWTGSGALCCSAKSACRMASRLLLEDYTEVNDEVLDAIGEIANMIVGSFKSAIRARTGVLGMSTPTVVCGRDLITGNGAANQWMVFPFSSHDYSFRMMVRLEPVHDASRHVHELSHTTADGNSPYQDSAGYLQ